MSGEEYVEYWRKHRRTWDEFRKTGLLWWINRQLHLFGWAIALSLDKDEDGNWKVIDVFPARVDFRGFSEQDEAEEFEKLTKYLTEHANELMKDILKVKEAKDENCSG